MVLIVLIVLHMDHASTLDQYITKQYLLAEDDYPADACPNRYYSKAKIDNWEVTN